MVAFIVNMTLFFMFSHFVTVKLEERGMIKLVIIETNSNTGNIWHAKRGERMKKELRSGMWEGGKEWKCECERKLARLRNSSGTDLISFHVLSVSSRRLCREEEGGSRRGRQGVTAKRGNKPGRKVGSGPAG